MWPAKRAGSLGSSQIHTSECMTSYITVNTDMVDRTVFLFVLSSFACLFTSGLFVASSFLLFTILYCLFICFSWNKI